MSVVHSIALFLIAGTLELEADTLFGNGGETEHTGAQGSLVPLRSCLYGIIPTYQVARFGRVYAAYGGWCVILSVFWGWK